MNVEVVRAGPSTTIQDLGRPGLLHQGVPRSGAADRRALALANRLLGNDPGAAALEATLHGPTLRCSGHTTVAVTGARAPVSVGGRPAGQDGPLLVAPGETVEVGAVTAGLRVYVAFRGGLAVEPVLGSRATDTLTGVGPPPVADGDELTLGEPRGEVGGVDVAPVATLPERPALRVVLGPRADCFTPEAIERLLGAEFTASSRADRVGVRLQGPELVTVTAAQLRSEPLVAGSLQVPPSGAPILLLADHPTVGGYPVIAVVVEEDLPLAAQLRPGEALTFRAP